MTDATAGRSLEAEPLGELRALVHDHRVHFDVQPEVVFRAGERIKVGFELRLWAVHDKGARALPGCGKCHELARALERLALEVLPGEVRDTRYAIEPARAALYESKVVPGADEICIVVRLIHRSGYERPVDHCEERCLKEICGSLKALGARES